MDNESPAVPENGIIITNIKWWKGHELRSKVNYSNLPESYQISIPNSMLDMYVSKPSQFKGEIETFVYNFLARKFGVEVSFCQIWLPLEESAA